MVKHTHHWHNRMSNRRQDTISHDNCQKNMALKTVYQGTLLQKTGAIYNNY